MKLQINVHCSFEFAIGFTLIVVNSFVCPAFTKKVVLGETRWRIQDKGVINEQEEREREREREMV